MRKTLLNTSIVAIIFTLLSIGAFAKDFDFKGKFGFDFSSTPESVYSTLSKKYANEIVQQKIHLSVMDYKFKNDLIVLRSEDTLKDFFNAMMIMISFDEFQRIEIIDLEYIVEDIKGDRMVEAIQKANQLLAALEIEKMSDRSVSIESKYGSVSYFSNCVVSERHSVKDNLFFITFGRRE